MPHIIYRESYGDSGPSFEYLKRSDSNRITCRKNGVGLSSNYFQSVSNILKELLLPHGFPGSVSDDYVEYQIWDTVQACCSTICNTLTTHAVLKGVGVGNTEASALSAAITWILKDGVGMLARIVFAWATGSGLDSECKKWRLFADGVNDVAMLVELCVLPLYPIYSLQILCASSSLKAVVGVAGGATRAAVTHHQAVLGNSGDISAKDGSQETCVNLLSSFLGILLLTSVTNSSYVWAMFACLIFLHLYANYRAVRCLRFTTLNPERFHLVLLHYLRYGTVPSPQPIAQQESVLLFSGLSDRRLCQHRVRLGSRLRWNEITSNQLCLISNLYKNERFLLIHSTGEIRVVLSPEHTPQDALHAYFHANILGIAAAIVNGTFPIILEDVTDSSEEVPLFRLIKLTSKWKKPAKEKLNIEDLIELYSYCKEEASSYFDNLKKMKWKVESHQLHVVDRGWRAYWAQHLTSSKSHED